MLSGHMPTAEAAVALGVDTRTIHRMIARGELRGEKLSTGTRSAFLIRRKDVERIAKDRGLAGAA